LVPYGNYDIILNYTLGTACDDYFSEFETGLNLACTLVLVQRTASFGLLGRETYCMSLEMLAPDPQLRFEC
jgi:hypothetical protein